MKEIVHLIMIVLFYGVGITFFIIMAIHESKMHKLHREYWQREIKRMEEMKRAEKKIKRKKESEEK